MGRNTNRFEIVLASRVSRRGLKSCPMLVSLGGGENCMEVEPVGLFVKVGLQVACWYGPDEK